MIKKFLLSVFALFFVIACSNVYAQDLTTTTVGALPQGTYIMDNSSIWKFRGYNYQGEVQAERPLIWQKIEDNHYSAGTTLLLSRYEVAYIGKWKYLPVNVTEGDVAWDGSVIRDFLRTTFYESFSQKFKNAIVEVDIPYFDIDGNLKSIKDNFFVMSVAEWGAEKYIVSPKRNFSEEGTKISYPAMMELYNFDSLDCSTITKKCKLYTNSTGMYTRTMYESASTKNRYGMDVYKIDIGGKAYKGFLCNNVRPAVNLKSSTVVKGPYKLTRKVFGYRDETIEYYEIQE